MKTSNILQVFAGKSWGGGEQYVYDLSKKLIDDSHRLFFIHRKSADIDTHIQSMNVISRQLPMRNCFDLYSVLTVALFIRKHHIDIIHTHHFKDAIIVALARLLSGRRMKIVLTRHLVKRAKTNRLYRWLYGQLDPIIFVSHLAKNEFLSSHPQISPDRIKVIHNSIAALPCDDNKDNTISYKTAPAQTLLAFVGRIDREKGIDVLIEALAIVKNLDFLLLIAGKGDAVYENELRRQVIDSGLEEKVIFTGFVDDVQRLIVNVDVGIVPTVGREAFGLAVIEFMMAGKPVITTDNGAQPEYITGYKDGILIPPADATALAAAVRLLIEDDSLRIEIGRQAKLTFDEKLSYPAFYRQIIEVYSE